MCLKIKIHDIEQKNIYAYICKGLVYQYCYVINRQTNPVKKWEEKMSMHLTS